MKLIKVDGLNRDSIADVLIQEDLTEEDGQRLLSEYIARHGSDFVWFLLVPDDHRLSRGMEDLV
jgi:hypothetical protein